MGFGNRKTYVEEDDLRHESDNNEDQQHISEPEVELRDALRLRRNGSTNTLNATDTESTDQTTHRDVHQHSLLAVLWTQP